jgi:hypothetical protein
MLLHRISSNSRASSNRLGCITRSGVGIGAVGIGAAVKVRSSPEVCLLSTFCCTSEFVTRQRGCCVLSLVLSCVCGSGWRWGQGERSDALGEPEL